MAAFLDFGEDFETVDAGRGVTVGHVVAEGEGRAVGGNFGGEAEVNLIHADKSAGEGIHRPTGLGDECGGVGDEDGVAH